MIIARSGVNPEGSRRELTRDAVLETSQSGSSDERPGRSGCGTGFSADDIAAFTDLVLSQDVQLVEEHLRGLVSDGADAEAVILHLMAPTARLLGDRWLADTCDFISVTLGTSCLQMALRGLAFDLDRDTHAFRPLLGRALLATMPGEQHSFGLSIVAEFMRQDGWDVTVKSGASVKELVRTVSSESFAVVGLSLSGQTFLNQMTACITAIRSASCRQPVGVMVGGALFNESPALAEAVGADAMAVDARDATLQARDLFAISQAHQSARSEAVGVRPMVERLVAGEHS